MDKLVPDNLDAENLITAKCPDQQKIQLGNEFNNINNKRTSDDWEQNNFVVENNSSSSGTSKNASNLSSDFNEVGESRVKVNEDVESINVVFNNENENDTISTNDSENHLNIRKRIRTIIDSDTEDEETTEFTSSITLNKSISIGTNFDKNNSTEKSKIKSSRLRINSDSDDEVDDIAADNNNDDDDDENLSDRDNETIIKIKSKKFSDLIDSESDNENDNRNANYSSTEESNKHINPTNVSQKKSKKNKPEKKRTGTKRASKDEAMRQIHSETQRLLREAPVSLPYHRPKQRSLQEFLNRKKIAPAIPQASTVAAKLKMCTAIVSEVVKEKEKEAELFYKSSDSEDDDIPVSTANESNNCPSSSSLSSITSVHKPVEDIQKLDKIDIENEQNKEEITQQGNMQELGVSRKLFVDDVKDPFDDEFSDTPISIRQMDDNSDAKNRLNEFKEGSKEIDVPQKLLNKNFDDHTDESSEKCDLRTSSDSLTLTTDHNINNNNQTIDGIIQSLDKNYSDNADNDENNSTDNKTSNVIIISSSKSTENSQDSLQISQNDKIIDLTATQSTSKSNTSSLPSKNIEISDTLLISNEEIIKLDDRNLIPEKSSSLSSEICLDDTSQSSEPGDCGVIGLPPPIFDSDQVIKIKPPQTTSMTVKKNALKNIPKLKPKLHGSPGTIIDFTQNSKPNKEAINSLVDRFLSRHSKINKHIEVNSEVSTIQTEKTTEGLKIYKDVLPYKLPAAIEASDDADMNKPGAKLMRLREELKKKMASKRNEEWKQREKELLMDEDELEDDAEELEPEDKDEISGMNAETSDVEESEPEENDVLITDKKRKSCAFGDDEAEVDEDEVMDLSDDEHEEDEEDEGENEEAEDEEDEEDVEGDEDKSEDADDKVENAQENRRKFNRIVAADDDSNSEEANAIDNKTYPVTFKRKRTDADMFDDYDDEEDELHINEKALEESQSSSFFKTPLTPNNKSNTFESRTSQFSSFNINSPDVDFNSKLNNSNSQLSDFQSQNDNGEIKNKLYNVQDCNVTDEELMALCSGRFTDDDNNTQNENQPRLTGLIDSTLNQHPITESQIIGMCSGTFSSQGLLSSTDLSGNADETSQDIRLTFDDTSQNSNDNILRKKHDEQRKNSGTQSFLDIASSSDDEIDNKINSGKNKKILKKKKVKQLVLSDDEDEEINEEDRQDNEDQEEDDLASDADEEKFIDYDSEENEVVVVNKKDLRKVAANFVDAEAELSESEWGSDDEDEKGMDKLELEEGDAEEIDEDQMRDQLGKLHARQVLDDDQRDVRMLKEMLFDDGDLHTDGAGRERRFKWRNIDKLGEENLLGPTNNDNDDDDDNQLDPVDLANEMEWRKRRLEREKFLEEKMKSDGDLDPLNSDINIDSGGEFLKLGIKVLKKCKTTIEIRSKNVETVKPIVPRTVSELIGTPEGKSRILHKAMKRGSFLARGDEALARLAVMINKSDTVDLAPKHSKNFLFTHISPSVNEEDDEDGGDNSENKREVTEKSIDKSFRKRKNAAGGTPRTAKKPKFDSNRSSGKKLF